MKQPSRIIPWLAVFAVGFFLGIVYSAWRLEKAPTSAPQGHSMGQKEGPSKEDIAKRIDAVTRMLEKDPNNIQALIQLGNDYSVTDNYEKAVETYQKALKLEPNNADLSTELAMAYRKLGKPELAVEAFRKAIEIDPDNSKALFYLGRVLMVDMKDAKGALEAWETFLKKSPDHPHAVMIKPWVEQLRQEVAKKN